MHLKSVEIVGFKSFADKTRIELKPGITGVVGPNGCGKTNVMEAIRWCLGEMSWKSLRSPSMVDVIFNGNARRKALSMAEVTLTFDNSESTLPVQYTEITVTRRIFRGGESEYVLNKTACRLKDIRELFLDTGIGGDGYAIIDQGGVDFVLNSKPEDRRSLFEEAAGVAKYRAKREEALRKLERVEADLDRLQDSIALITDQIKKLDSDARKAKLHQKYKEELAAQEVGQLLQEVGALAAEAEKEAGLLEPVRQNLENRRVELDAEEGRLSALRLEATRQQAQAGETGQKIVGLKAEVGRLLERADNARGNVEQLLGRREKDLREIEDGERRLKELDPAMEDARRSQAQAAEGLEAVRKERDAFAAGLREIQSEIDDLGRDIESLGGGYIAAAQAVQDASGNLSRLGSAAQESLGNLKVVLKELSKESARADGARADLESRAGEAARLAARVEESRRAQAEAAAARSAKEAELAAAKEAQVSARMERNGLQTRLQLLEEQGGKDPYWVGANAVLAADIPGVLGTLRSLITVEPGFERFAEDALGERLYSLVCEDLASAQNAVEFLERSGRGRARLLVLSSLPEAIGRRSDYPPQAKPLLDCVTWDPRIQAAMLTLLAECYCLGRSLYGDHWICGGTEPRETVASQLSDIGGLRSRLADLEERERAAAERRVALEAELGRADQAVQSAAAEAQDAVNHRNAFELESGNRASALDRAREDEKNLTAEAASYLRELAGVREETLSARSRLEESRAEEGRVTGLRAEKEKALDKLKASLEARQGQGESLEKALEQWRSQHKLAEDQCARLAVEEEALRDAGGRRRADIAEIDENVARSLKTEADSKAAVEQFHRELARAETEAQALGAKVSEALKTIETLEGSVKSIRGRCEELRGEIQQSELKAGELKAKREALVKRLWDDWQLTLEEAGAKHPEAAVDPQRIETLRRRIQNMGPVNQGAPEEYEKLTRENEFRLAQVADLSKAKDDLREAIAKINATTREHFRQTFTEVRDHFQRIYASLFEGGEADLVLTDRENLLETGVDIVAQPPGKRLQSITQLSGGERTLTAIALLFAFFMVKPSPMCMLDEADAALDEANVGRFAAMLREFSVRSQFLTISHNKKTMAAADQIYGVTMEESGVSQLISVDFQPQVDAPAPASVPGAALAPGTPAAENGPAGADPAAPKSGGADAA